MREESATFRNVIYIVNWTAFVLGLKIGNENTLFIITYLIVIFYLFLFRAVQTFKV